MTHAWFYVVVHVSGHPTTLQCHSEEPELEPVYTEQPQQGMLAGFGSVPFTGTLDTCEPSEEPELEPNDTEQPQQGMWMGFGSMPFTGTLDTCEPPSLGRKPAAAPKQLSTMW